MTRFNVGDLILASSSSLRLTLLKQIGVTPCSVINPDIDEKHFSCESPQNYVERISNAKVSVVSQLNPGKCVLGADTTVYCKNMIMPKAKTKSEANCYIRALSGRRHRVITVVSVFSPNKDRILSRSSVSIIKFKRLTERDITDYLNTEEWYNKAAGCSLQGFASGFIVWMRGSYTGAIGLPLYETSCLLSAVV